MTSSYTNLGIELMVTGANSGTWGSKTNTNLEIVEQIQGYVNKSIAGGAQTTDLAIADGSTSSSDARNLIIELSGTITGNQVVTVPDGIEKSYIVYNNTSGAFTVEFKTFSGTGTTFSTTDKGIKIVYSNGTNIIDVGTNPISISEYYAGGANVPSGTSGPEGSIPSSGQISMGVFRGTVKVYSANFLIVAGGASGGKSANNPNGEGAGGGGAGGYRTSTQNLTPGNTITVTVGGGGARETNSNTIGNVGSASSISSPAITNISSTAGGYGGTFNTGGGSGGSGGGGGSGPTGNQPAGPGIPRGAGTAGQGNNGGNGAQRGYAGGGGGAGGAGANANSSPDDPGNGGAGAASSISGPSVTRAGGGGGGGNALGSSGGSGGGGAGGNGGNGGDATANTGSGGGGGAKTGFGGAGGSGTVIIRVPTANYPGTRTGSPVVTTSGSDTILSFTGSGSYTA
jgi:hypothetical protein